MEKQLNEQESERVTSRSTIEQLQSQMSEMQESHQRAREEYERVVKQMKQENDRLNEQVKQHLADPTSSNGSTRKSFVHRHQIFRCRQNVSHFLFRSSVLNPPNKAQTESAAPPTVQPEIFLYKYLTGWKDAFNELTIYLEERLKNNPQAAENNEKVRDTVVSMIPWKEFFSLLQMAQTMKAFQQHAENFLVQFKSRLFEGQVKNEGSKVNGKKRKP